MEGNKLKLFNRVGIVRHHPTIVTIVVNYEIQG